MITVRQVNNHRKGMKEFVNLPYWLYRNDKNWCPPLRIERKNFFSHKNPFMEHSRVAYFVAYEGNKAVGRVTAHIDEVFNRYHATNQGFFGFFESIESLEVVEILMNSAENWLRTNGTHSIMGPLNFSTNHEVGFLIKGFERPPVIMMPYTKRYYPDMLYKLGYRKEKELIAYWTASVKKIPDIVVRTAEKVNGRFGDSIEIRNLSKRKLISQLGLIRDIYNEAWSKNWGFVPISDAEIREIARELRLFGIPDITCMLYRNGEAAGFLIAIPDINEVLIRIKNGRLFPTGIFKLLFLRNRIRNARVLIMGVRSAHRKLGLDFLMYNQIYDAQVNKTGIENIEMSWVLEDNTSMRRVLERLNADPYKRYVIVSKTLAE